MTERPTKPLCEECQSPYHYKSFCPYRRRTPIAVKTPLPRQTKPIAKRGKRTKEYDKWRDTVAKPYLDKTYGHVCAACKGLRCGNRMLDVDHIQNRSTHASQRMELSNVQYLGRFPCHVEKTTGMKPASQLNREAA